MMKINFTQRNIYIILFAILYISVALVSTIHAISFFALANMTLLAILLACTFEIGQATVLFSILTSSKERSKIVPWCLMGVLTLVQVLGNVFASYKYLITNSGENLRYFKEPVFIWTDLPDQQCNVILTYIIGSIMPIVALLMTSMVANYLEDTSSENNVKKIEQDLEEKNEEIINENNIVNTTPKQEPILETTIEPTLETTIKPTLENTIEPTLETINENNKLNSHFVNI